MSLKSPKNLVIFVGIVAALLVGTVLLGNYANIVTAESNIDSQAKTEQATFPTCPKAKAHFAENTKTSCPQAGAGFDAEACPLGRTKPCCAEDVAKSGCGKPCPLDCTKPCCAEQTKTGCCPMSGQSQTTSTCCSSKTDTATQ
jgi:hypothetical protein